MRTVEYRHVEQTIVTPPVAPVTVLAPAGWLWSHPRLRGWAVWLRTVGWRGWLPSWAVGRCCVTYPDYVCPCGAYVLVWPR